MNSPFQTVPEIEPILKGVKAAAKLVKTIQLELASQSLTKEDRSPVTVADFVSQAVICKIISENFPNDRIVAEESSEPLTNPENRKIKELVVEYTRKVFPEANDKDILAWIDRGMGNPGERFWTIDPIDGTKGFLRGDQYAVALALIENGNVKIGALACPNLRMRTENGDVIDGVIAVGVRGMGSYMSNISNTSNWYKLSVSRVSNPEEARILRSFESGHTNAEKIDSLARLLGIENPPIRLDSQAKYLLLAGGEGEIYVRLLSPKRPDYKEKIWDQAAGSLIIEEAGGKVTDLDGKPLDFTTGRTLAKNRGILATNKHLHPITLEKLRELEG